MKDTIEFTGRQSGKNAPKSGNKQIKFAGFIVNQETGRKKSCATKQTLPELLKEEIAKTQNLLYGHTYQYRKTPLREDIIKYGPHKFKTVEISKDTDSQEIKDMRAMAKINKKTKDPKFGYNYSLENSWSPLPEAEHARIKALNASLRKEKIKNNKLMKSLIQK